MIKKKTNRVYTLLTMLTAALLVFISFSCKRNALHKIKPTTIELDIIRFEKELFNQDLYNFTLTANKLKSKHKEFLPLFSNKIIEIGDTSNLYFSDALKRFVSDQAIYNIYKKTNELDKIHQSKFPEIKQAFGRWATIFPNKEIPTIYTYISGFNQTIAVGENILGVSLEKYLGKEHGLYKQVYPPIQAYQKYVMTPERIPSDIIRAWAMTEIPYDPAKDNLISQMIYHGQIMYLTKNLLPETADTTLWGFTPAQLDFCKAREKFMWAYLVEQELLFNSESFRINQFIGEAPFTKDFTNESPGRAAVWIGYNIVLEYAKNNKTSPFEGIVTNNNYQAILNESNYRP